MQIIAQINLKKMFAVCVIEVVEMFYVKST